MKFSALEEYGLRCLLQLARRCPIGSLTIPEIARIEGLSIHTVGKMMRILRQAGFVSSSRGQAGGYSLSLPPEKISVGEVLSSLGGQLFDSTFCDRHKGIEECCTHTVNCSIRGLLKTMQNALDGVLRNLTLKDLVCSEEALHARLQGSAERENTSQDL